MGIQESFVNMIENQTNSDKITTTYSNGYTYSGLPDSLSFSSPIPLFPTLPRKPICSLASMRHDRSFIRKMTPGSRRLLQIKGYLFEGHLTLGREPPQPRWLVQSNLLTAAMAAGSSFESGPGIEENSEGDVNLLQSLIDNLDSVLPPGILDDVRAASRVPPARKQVVANLPVITITEEVLKELGKDADCCICKENLVVNDKMQELPCKHTFHPPCLKPWLDEHNSCPICRDELQTDDHVYENWKEREKEAEEDRK